MKMLIKISEEYGLNDQQKRDLVKNIIKIQSLYRGYLFRKIKKIIKIQSLYRDNLYRKIKNTIKIQSLYRGYLSRKNNNEVNDDDVNDDDVNDVVNDDDVNDEQSNDEQQSNEQQSNEQQSDEQQSDESTDNIRYTTEEAEKMWSDFIRVAKDTDGYIKFTEPLTLMKECIDEHNVI